MSDIINFFKLVRIERRRIRELATCWRVSIEEMAEIGRQLMEDRGDDQEFARKLYYESSPPALKRVENFRSVVKSIRDNGYITSLDMPLKERQKLFPCSKVDTLPRVFAGNKLDDGRHRCAALLANGIEETLVAYCEHTKMEKDKVREYGLLELCNEIRQAGLRFLEEEELGD